MPKDLMTDDVLEIVAIQLSQIVSTPLSTAFCSYSYVDRTRSRELARHAPKTVLDELFDTFSSKHNGATKQLLTNGSRRDEHYRQRGERVLHAPMILNFVSVRESFKNASLTRILQRSAAKLFIKIRVTELTYCHK